MTIAGTVLDQNRSNISGISQATASVTPTANNGIVLQFTSFTLGIDPTGLVSASGCSLTWTLLDQTYNSTSQTYSAVFIAQGASPTTGAITISGLTGLNGIAWVVTDFSGVLSTGFTNSNHASTNNGAGVGNTGTVTLSTLQAGSGIYGLSSFGNAGASATGGSGCGALMTVPLSFNNGRFVDCFNATGTTTPSITWSGGADRINFIAFEMLGAPASGSPTAGLIVSTIYESDLIGTP